VATEYLFKYLQERCGDLRILRVPRIWREPPNHLGQYLSSLRAYCGPFGFASSSIALTSPIEDLRLTISFTYPPYKKTPQMELGGVALFPDRLQRLEMSVESLKPSFLEYILDRFTALVSLKFTNIKSPPSDSATVGSSFRLLKSSLLTDVPIRLPQSFFAQFPSSYIPSLNKLTTFVVTSWPRSTGFHHEPLTSQVLWQRTIVKAWGRRNPLLKEMGLYYVGWWKHGRDELDWGWSLLEPDPWLLD
jgi:hypothetical protein